MNNRTVLGIDIGGSHITAALVDLETKDIIGNSEQRQFVDSNGSANEILDSWCAVINKAFDGLASSERKIGIAMPGPFDYEVGISLIQDQEKFRSLYRMNLKHELAKRLDIEEKGIVFLNDAAAFLQGEVFSGAAMNQNRVLGLTLGTGLGAAISIDGKASDAELWNSKFKDGIAEDYLSTRWFLKSYLHVTRVEIKGVKELSESQDFKAEVQKIFDVFAGNLAVFIRSTAEEMNLPFVVLGGNISSAYPFFLSTLNKCLAESNMNIVVKIAELNEKAALIGAASSLWTLESAE
jgi:glucokinase